MFTLGKGNPLCQVRILLLPLLDRLNQYGLCTSVGFGPMIPNFTNEHSTRCNSNTPHLNIKCGFRLVVDIISLIL